MSMLESCQRIDDQEKLLKSRLKTRIYILNIWFQNMEDARMQDFRGGGGFLTCARYCYKYIIISRPARYIIYRARMT